MKEKKEEVQENEFPATPTEKGGIEWTAPSGAKIVCIAAKAKHAALATRTMDGDGSKYIAAIMAEIATIDGEKWVMERILEDMSLQDYNVAVVNLGEANFI